MSKTIQIRCKGAETRKLGTLHNFQGDLKTLTKENAKRLRSEISKLGFSEPISIWEHEGTDYILNGHPRVAVLTAMRAEGYDIPPLPVSIIEADSYGQAKHKGGCE